MKLTMVEGKKGVSARVGDTLFVLAHSRFLPKDEVDSLLNKSLEYMIVGRIQGSSIFLVQAVNNTTQTLVEHSGFQRIESRTVALTIPTGILVTPGRLVRLVALDGVKTCGYFMRGMAEGAQLLGLPDFEGVAHEQRPEALSRELAAKMSKMLNIPTEN